MTLTSEPLDVAPMAGALTGRPALATAPGTPGAPYVADVGELYRALAPRLEQIVRLDVRAPDPVIEDACQFAWSRLVHHSHRVHRDGALTWLVRTAVHEAFKLIRREGRELSLDAAAEDAGELPFPAHTPGPEELAETRERLEGIGRLPERQRRFLWLHALGLSYAEIAVHTGCSVRTVERQLLRAKARLRAAELAA
jgi:RNA polymerase sigma-70 factor (ECF subfamily)